MPTVEEAVKIQEEKQDRLLDISDTYDFFREFYNFVVWKYIYDYQGYINLN